jgi:hypothetical protein
VDAGKKGVDAGTGCLDGEQAVMKVSSDKSKFVHFAA